MWPILHLSDCGWHIFLFDQFGCKTTGIICSSCFHVVFQTSISKAGELNSDIIITAIYWYKAYVVLTAFINILSPFLPLCLFLLQTDGISEQYEIEKKKQNSCWTEFTTTVTKHTSSSALRTSLVSSRLEKCDAA